MLKTHSSTPLVFQSNVDLSAFNTFHFRAKARYLVEINHDSLWEALIQHPIFIEYWTQKRVFILGGGSNLILKNDYDGLVIKITTKGVEKLTHPDEDHIIIRAKAGEVWHDFVQYTLSQQWFGLENLSLIPGTVGASPIQNIGAYGKEVGHFIDAIHYFNFETNSMARIAAHDCLFAYRDSIFKGALSGKVVITAVDFKLNTQIGSPVLYGDIEKRLQAKQRATPYHPMDIAHEIIMIRQEKLPDPNILGNAGSFFKNPIVSVEKRDQLLAIYPQMPHYPYQNQAKLAAGWLIEQAGFKGFRDGDVGCHAQQALVLVNYGGASGKNIVDLAMRIQESVHTKFGVMLIPEVNII